MALVKTTVAGQLILPLEMRLRYGITSGVAVRVVDDGGKIVIMPALRDPVHEVRGMFAIGTSLRDVLLALRGGHLGGWPG